VVDALVQQARPRAMADAFSNAGYRTVFAQPANRYRNISRWAYGFDAVYAGWDFDYRGPSFGWANMPDQYVIDFMHHHEVHGAGRPLLLVYALQSSHAPWSEQPELVGDWSRLGDGAIYRGLEARRFSVGWNNLGAGGEAYLRSITYDLEVLVQYVTRFVEGDTLVVIAGDHQPVAEVTRYSASHAVPVHVISRRRAFVERFEARGYAPGMHPVRHGTPSGMETFLPDLVADFSAHP
jgi:hypothetical protein